MTARLDGMALDEILDEHEQGERVRAWLRDNGAALIGGVVLGLGAIFGWKWWQQQQHADRVAAGAAYLSAIEQVETVDPAEAAPVVAGLDAAPYEALGALHLAQAQVREGDVEAAIATLRGAPVEDPSLARIVQLRLARLLVDAGQADEALSLLADADQPATLELRGDAAAALGQDEAAREAYGQALAALDAGAPQRQLVEIKLVAVGGTPPDTGTDAADDSDAG